MAPGSSVVMGNNNSNNHNMGAGNTPLAAPGQEVKASFMRNQLEALFQPSDNKLAMKLFGSKKALMNERQRQKAAGHWVIHPCSNFR